MFKVSGLLIIVLKVTLNNSLLYYAMFYIYVVVAHFKNICEDIIHNELVEYLEGVSVFLKGGVHIKICIIRYQIV